MQSKLIQAAGEQLASGTTHYHPSPSSTEDLEAATTCEQPLAYILYEYCPKNDLFAYVVEGATVGNEKLCHALFYQIINAMDYLHNECNKAHLDIKLENIVLDSHYFTKLIDFAYCEPKYSQMCVAKGTERYFAPEVAQIFYRRK